MESRLMRLSPNESSPFHRDGLMKHSHPSAPADVPNLAPYGRWTLRDKAQRRDGYLKRWAS